MATSQNGWPALPAGSDKLRVWRIPAKNGLIKVTLRNGSAGFLLSHYAMWHSEAIEDVSQRRLDDWGWAYRSIRGQTSGLSNHASGTAIDLNATQHPLGTRTLTSRELEKIAKKLRQYRGCLRSGAFYSGRVDEMHTEINAPLSEVETLARRLMRTPRGERILKANPGQRKVILS